MYFKRSGRNGNEQSSEEDYDDDLEKQPLIIIKSKLIKEPLDD